MQTAEMEMKQIQAVAEQVKSDHTQRFPEAASFGEFIRQGDVYITLLDVVPKGAKASKPVSQLAPGTDRGSRHILSSTEGVEFYTLANPTEYDGPVLRVAREVTVTHPEHGDWVLPCGVYGVSYQRTEDLEGKIRRVRD